MTPPRLRPTPPLPVLAGVLVALLLALGACASGSDDAGTSESSGGAADSGGASAVADGEAASGRDEAEVPVDAPQADAVGSAYAADGSVAREASQASSPGSRSDLAPVDGRSLIKTGTVSLRGEDVGRALFDVRTIVQGSNGEISEENTEADDDGEEERALLTVRVPTDAFDAVIDRLTTIEGMKLVDSTTATDDVTSQVVDTRVRVALQRRSIDRISVLLDRATSIRDIVAIERELAQREADLGSLERRQAVLANQTSLSTITVAIDRPRRTAEPTVTTRARIDAPAGFGSGLSDGWAAFTATTTGLLTFAGAVLPFALVLALIGVPVWLLVRRRRPVAGAVAQPAAEPAGS